MMLCGQHTHPASILLCYLCYLFLNSCFPVPGLLQSHSHHFLFFVMMLHTSLTIIIVCLSDACVIIIMRRTEVWPARLNHNRVIVAFRALGGFAESSHWYRLVWLGHPLLCKCIFIPSLHNATCHLYYVYNVHPDLSLNCLSGLYRYEIFAGKNSLLRMLFCARENLRYLTIRTKTRLGLSHRLKWTGGLVARPPSQPAPAVSFTFSRIQCINKTGQERRHGADWRSCRG